jgi:hypothetical protein
MVECVPRVMVAVAAGKNDDADLHVGLISIETWARKPFPKKSASQTIQLGRLLGVHVAHGSLISPGPGER